MLETKRSHFLSVDLRPQEPGAAAGVRAAGGQRHPRPARCPYRGGGAQGRPGVPDPEDGGELETLHLCVWQVCNRILADSGVLGKPFEG